MSLNGSKLVCPTCGQRQVPKPFANVEPITVEGREIPAGKAIALMCQEDECGEITRSTLWEPA